MSAQKTFSQLSIAAVVLFVVSIPCLAQTDSITNEKSVEPTTVVAVNTTSATRSLPTEEKSVFESKQKAPKFSAAQFMQAANEAPAVKQSTNDGYMYLNAFEPQEEVNVEPAFTGVYPSAKAPKTFLAKFAAKLGIA